MQASVSKRKNRADNFSKTMLRLLSYFKGYRLVLVLVIFLVIFSSFANIYGTYMSKDVINYLTDHVLDPKPVQLE